VQKSTNFGEEEIIGYCMSLEVIQITVLPSIIPGEGRRAMSVHLNEGAVGQLYT
jgi:hypothetical protein